MTVHTDLPSFLIDPARIDAATRHLSAHALGVYLRLIFHQWMHGHVPTDAGVRERIAQGCRRAWPELSSLFEAHEGQLRASWLEEERSAARNRLEAARKRTQSATQARWRDRPVRSRSATPTVTESVTDASRSALRLASNSTDTETTPHPHSGVRGVGGGGCNVEEPEDRTSEPESFAAGRAAHERRFGDDAESEFRKSVESRRALAARKFEALGVNRDRIDDLVRAALDWPWDAFSDRLDATCREAREKSSPGGWLLSALVPRERIAS